MAIVTAPKPNNDLALQYILEKKYCSYSSLKHVRDCTNPFIKYAGESRWGEIGTETHSRWLEGRAGAVQLLGEDEERLVSGMVRGLQKHKMAMALHKAATGFEVLIDKKLDGVPFIGYIDLLRKKHFAGDLKTYGHTNQGRFIEDQDFLQPACYMKAEHLYEFYYIGVSKINTGSILAPKHEVCTFSVLEYRARITQAQKELTALLKYVKKKIF